MPIPQHIKASQGLARSEHYLGQIDTARLPRLERELAAATGPLEVDLGLDRDMTGDWLSGSIRGSLQLQCQRCLNAFGWPLDAALRLRLVHSEAEEERVLQEADPYRVENDRLPLWEVVEDEVLLALPMMPRCQACENAAPWEAPASETVEPSEKKANPLASLASLTNKR